MRPKGNFVIPALSIFISKNNRYLAQRSCLGHTVYKINSTSFWRYFNYKLSSLESQIYIYKKNRQNCISAWWFLSYNWSTIVIWYSVHYYWIYNYEKYSISCWNCSSLIWIKSNLYWICKRCGGCGSHYTNFAVICDQQIFRWLFSTEALSLW